MTEKILIVRNDRLGDTILALPTVSLIKEMYPTSEVYFWANSSLTPLLRFVRGIDEVISSENDKSAKLLKMLREWKFSIAYCLNPTSMNALTMFRASIPKRVGTARRWYSLAFNKRMNLSRRGGRRHEAILNLDLVSPDRQTEEFPFPEIVIPNQHILDIESLLLEKLADSRKSLIIVHPGSGLSSVNWHPAYFRKLVEIMAKNSNVEVVVTGIQSEYELCKEVAGSESINLCGETDLVGMAALIKKADLLISNSTGPLHLAVALGCKVVGLYPPKKDCLPERWGPYQHPEWAIMPDLPLCNACKPGRISSCRCMEEILPQSVYDKSLELIQD